MRAVRRAGPVLACGLLASCGGGSPEVTLHADGAYPERLSAWGLMRTSGGRLVPNEGVLPYALNTALFSDYAQKLRTVWMPAAARPARYDAESAFEFPIGTILTKTFYYPRAEGGATAVRRAGEGAVPLTDGGLDLDSVRLVETRLLVREPDSWVALPYVWDAEQGDATLAIVGDTLRLTLTADDGDAEEFAYVVPNRNECAGCHATDHTSGALEPIGPKARHLNRAIDYLDGPVNQLVRWTELGYLTGAPDPERAPRSARWDPEARDALDHRARSYLDINCAHCHNPAGAADTSGLFLHSGETDRRRLGYCKPPVAAGRGSGGRRASIVPGAADASILLYRMITTDPGERMPESGRSTSHAEGVELIRAWIDSLEGSCS